MVLAALYASWRAGQLQGAGGAGVTTLAAFARWQAASRPALTCFETQEPERAAEGPVRAAEGYVKLLLKLLGL